MPFEARYYILDSDRQPRRVAMLEWAQYFEHANRHVANDTVGDVHISTVFLGVDHRHYGSGPPLIFETMIFGGELDGSQWRYSTWDDAEVGHAMAVKRVRERSKV